MKSLTILVSLQEDLRALQHRNIELSDDDPDRRNVIFLAKLCTKFPPPNKLSELESLLLEKLQILINPT